MVLSSTTIFKWELTLYGHGNRLHFELLILASETSILLHMNCSVFFCIQFINSASVFLNYLSAMSFSLGLTQR